MAATTTAFQAHDPEKHQGVSSGPTLHGAGAGTEKNGLESGTLPRYDSDDVSSIHKGDFTHRKLKPRHIQLIGIGGTIGTALYVQIGRGLIQGGPGSLFLAFTIWWVATECSKAVFPCRIID